MVISRFLYFFVLVPCLSQASELQYFDQKIDYWGKGSAIEKQSSPTSPLVEKQNGSFPWKTYLDPKNKEFFKEGDYTPPEPFMEIARNPSDENIKQWFEFMKKKNELSHRLEIKMQEYLAKNGGEPVAPITAKAEVSHEGPKKEVSHAPFDPSRFRVRMYFESTCPHCRRMFGVLRRLKDLGIEVEALQVDTGPVPEDEKIVPIATADPAEIKKHGIKGVPFVLIADTKRKALLPSIEGYHDFDEVIGLLRAASN